MMAITRAPYIPDTYLVNIFGFIQKVSLSNIIGLHVAPFDIFYVYLDIKLIL